MSTFSIYKLNPKYIREQILSKLTWSVKYLFDAWPENEFKSSTIDANKFLSRISSGDVDGCDFIVHHSLLKSLMNDNFEVGKRILKYGANRKLHSRNRILRYSKKDLGSDKSWYERLLLLSDEINSNLKLEKPPLIEYQRSLEWMSITRKLLKASSPIANLEIKKLKPTIILARTSQYSPIKFGGYSSSLAWSTIILNSECKTLVNFLVQVIHELGHQLLFALTTDTPLAFNNPEELYESPIRKDNRPMDGIIHACFVSARVFEVLNLIKQNKFHQNFTSNEQAQIDNHCISASIAVEKALMVIKDSACLSALGERVILASENTINIRRG